jgi:hypothetical protein
MEFLPTPTGTNGISLSEEEREQCVQTIDFRKNKEGMG